MNWKLFNQPLGTIDMSGGYAPRKKPIAMAVPLALAAGSALTSWLGGNASAKKNEEVQRQLDAEKAETKAERMRAKYQDWLSTLSGQNTMRKLISEGDRSLSRAEGAAAIGGATEAAKAEQKELNALKQAEVIADAAAAHEDRKERNDAAYRQELRGLNQQQINLDREKANNIATVAGGVSNALAQGAISTFGGTKLGQQMMGAGSPGGSGVAPQPQPSQLQQMGKVEVPKVGHTMFEHQYGKTAPINSNLNDWLRKVASGFDFSSLNS